MPSIIMQTKTRLIIKTGENRTVALCAHPQMTSQELQQLIQASACLCPHLSSSTSKCQRPGFVRSRSKNLLTDYLLTSTSFRLSRIMYFQNKHASLSHPYHNAKSQPRLKPSQPREDEDQKITLLNLEFFCAASQKENQTVYINYEPFQKRRLGLKDTNDEQRLKFQSLVSLKATGEGFFERIMVGKQSLNSFAHFQKLMKIREKLISETKNNSNIYQRLIKTSQEQQNLTFWFSYTPAIRIAEVMKYPLRDQCKKVLVEKIVGFIIYLSTEGFQKYIRSLSETENMSYLLDKINLDLNQNLYLADLNLINQKDEKQTGQLTKNEWTSIQRQVNSYSLTQSQQNRITQENTASFDDIFTTFFSSRSYTSKLEIQDNYASESNFFSWSFKPLEKYQLIDKNEGTTVKKKLLKEESPKKRGKSQKTRIKYLQQLSLGCRKEKKSSKKKNKSFA